MLIRPGAIGDCILALPALEFLKAEYTEVWAPGVVLPLMRFADRSRSIVSTGLDGVEFSSKLVEELRSFDSIVSWYGAKRPEFRAALLDLGLEVEFLAALPDGSVDVHCADFFARQVGAPVPSFPRISVEELGSDAVIVIHPFSGGARKNWPLQRYRELAARLPLPVRWCAGPEESLEGAIRFDDLYELAKWLGRARVYVGNDSGITHLAAAAGCRVVGIFGPTDPAVWGPRGSDVKIVRGDLEAIPVDNVLNAIYTLL